MLKYRLIFGPLLVAALVGVLWLDEVLSDNGMLPGMLFFTVILGVAVLAALELNRIFVARGIATSGLVTCLAVIAGLSASSLTPRDVGEFSGVAIVCTAGGAVLLIALIFYSRHQSANGVVTAAAATLLAFVYPGLLGGFLVVMRKEYSGWLVLAILMVTKSYDIGAYFTGRWLGRNKLIEWLSPGKTWEGLFGGVVVSSLVGMAAASLSGLDAGSPRMPLIVGMGMGALFGLIGQGGDLVASLMKRDAGIKDYSATLPGFGGVLDVVDSPLLVAPVAYWLLVVFRYVGEEPEVGAHLVP